MKRVCFVIVLVAGCARVATPSASNDSGLSIAANRMQDASIGASSSDDGGGAALAIKKKIEPVQIDPDGNDDEEDVGTGKVPETAHWEKVGTPPLALTRICDLTPFQGSLYAAHANQPLGTDGATITKYKPDDPKSQFRVAYDWNRPGEPVKGGGAGQGFVRVHAIGGRLFVPDADPPYGGLGLVDWGTEGYVFVSDDKGTFASPRAPHFRPPGPPELRIGADAGARPGAGVLPHAYHVLDVIKYRGAFYASTGSVPPSERAWHGDSPGALHRANADGSRWTYETDYPFPYKDGVWRLTYMVRFKDRLYAGIQDYDGRDPNDFVYFTPNASGASADAGAAGTTVLTHEDAHPTRITRVGASGTLRWWVDTQASPHRLYWLAWTKDGIVIRVTVDGDHWAAIAMPEGGVIPTDITRFRDSVVVLTDHGLVKLQGPALDGEWTAPSDGVADTTATMIASVDETTAADAGAAPANANANANATAAKKKKSQFEVTDFFCTAPMAVLNNVLYAGGQRGGTLYRLAE